MKKLLTILVREPEMALLTFLGGLVSVMAGYASLLAYLLWRLGA